MKKILNSFWLISALIISFQTHSMVGTSFTLQGELVKSDVPVNGTFNISASLYDAETNGTYLTVYSVLSVSVTNGIFTVEFDPDPLYFKQGREVWVELEFTDTSDFSSFTMPRQLITNAPFAVYAHSVGDNSVYGGSVVDGSLTGADLLNNSISSEKLVTGSVTTEKINDQAITSAKIANNSVLSEDIQNLTIQGEDIATGAIGSMQILDQDINEADLKIGAVSSSRILDGTITQADVDSTSIQRRVSASCAAGSSIREINQDGTVTCETDDSGSSGWGLTGNTGTIGGTNFIGTNDSQPFVIKVNTARIAQFDPLNNVILGAGNNSVLNSGTNSSVLGGGNNSVSSPGHLSTYVTIGGGENNSVYSTTQSVSHSTIGGGSDNTVSNEGATISGGEGNTASGNISTVSGGSANKATGTGAFVGGGNSNTSAGLHSSIIGGIDNQAGGSFSFAAGRNAKVRNPSQSGDSDGDEGTFVWASSGTDFTSTGPFQFLIEASGGMGVNTNTLSTPFHFIGTGTTNFSPDFDHESIMVLQNTATGEDVSIVLDKRDNSAENAVIFSNNGTAEFDFRGTNSGMEFNYYHPTNGKVTYMDYVNGAGRLDVSTNIEPLTDNTYHLGNSSYRWDTVFTTNVDTTNAVNVTSDKRLKDDISNLDYGLLEILSLRPVSYKMKYSESEQLHLGLIAQEVESVIPEIVQSKNDEAKTRSLRYGELLPVLIKATQEQQVLIDQQSQQIEQLQVIVKELMSAKTSLK
jgi:hypothetical protein